MLREPVTISRAALHVHVRQDTKEMVLFVQILMSVPLIHATLKAPVTTSRAALHVHVRQVLKEMALLVQILMSV